MTTLPSTRMRAIRRLCLLTAVLALPQSLYAHHSYAMFDQSKTLTVKGSVHALEWTNPHVWVWVVVANGNGGKTTYGFETNAPSELARFFGWSKRALAAGEAVTVDYAPLRSGRSGGALRTITRADGSVLKTPRSDPNYETGPTGNTSPAGATGSK